MSGFRLEHLMSQLLLQLNVTENHERFLRYVQRTSVTSVKVTQASSGATRKRLADLSGDTAAFNGHYDHLRQMQLRELDSFVALLGKIADDAELSAALAAICLDKEAGEMQLSDSSTSANGAGRASSTTTSEAVASLRDLQRIEAAMAEALMHPNAAVAAATTNVSPLLITTTGAESPVQAALAAGAKSGAKKGPNPLGATTGATQVTSLPALVALPASAKKDVLSKLVSTTSGTAHSADKVLETNIGPKMPPWVRTGEHVSVLNLKKRASAFPKDISQARKEDGGILVPSLKSCSLAVQEQALVEDLLFLMAGFDGRYISISSFDTQPHSGPTFQTAPSIDRALDHLVGRVLPICSSFLIVQSYVEEGLLYEQGLISHVLCSAIQTLSQEYLVLVAQLEHEFTQGALTLQRLWFFVQPSAANLRSLESLVHILRENRCKGGAILDHLHEQMVSFAGDTGSRDMYAYLLEEASRPYFSMIEDWIYKGLINDPYLEFMVRYLKPKADDDSAKIFSENYILHKVPSFLDGVSSLILNTGRYLNVIRRCNLPVPERQTTTKLLFSANESSYLGSITSAHAFAAEQLLNLLMNDKQLVQRLHAIKRYFFLESGDLFVHFVDIAGADLNKNVHDISVSKVQSLLEIAVRMSASGNDPFSDDLSVSFGELSLMDELMRIFQISHKDSSQAHSQKLSLFAGVVSSPAHVSRAPTSLLTGIQALKLQYKVEWPLSLVLNNQALQEYQMIFRHIFFCQHIERQLGAMWLGQKTWKAFNSPVVMRAFNMRHRMLSFIQSFQYYIMIEVLEPQWIKFQEELTKVRTIDDVIKQHADFLKTCLDQTMLTDEALLKILNQLFSMCLVFCNQVGSIPVPQRVDRNSAGLTDFSALERAVQRLEEVFGQNLKEFLILLLSGKHYLTTSLPTGFQWLCQPEYALLDFFF